MYNRLHFKIVLILVVFIFSVMAVVGTILLNNVFVFYTDSFVEQMDGCFGAQMKERLENALAGEDKVKELGDIMTAFSGPLGINVNRQYYVLDAEGDVLASSSDAAYVTKTRNLLSAMNGESSSRQLLGDAVMDYAYCVFPSGNKENGVGCIIYIADNKEEMHKFAWQIFAIIVQALLVGLIIALILSFFLAKAITSPIIGITKGAAKLAEGDFSEKLTVHSQDEIGVLTETFNTMADELKRTLDEVSGEREKLETIFAYLNDGVVAFDNGGGQMHINETAKKLLEVDSPEKMTLRQLLGLLVPDTDPGLVLTKQSEPLVFREIQYKDKTLDLSVGRFNIELENRPYGGVICVLHDVTEHFALEKSRREFIATVSHELRTPLTGIRGATETVMENPDMPEEMKTHFLDMVVRESDRMTRIVKDLLMLSRLDNKRMSWKISRFDPSKLLSGCVDMLQIEAGRRHQTLSVSLPSDPLPEIDADKERIEQVIINVVQNAMKYTPENGTIRTSAGTEFTHADGDTVNKKYIFIRVADNGIGIPAEDIPHLFERFYRVEKARSSETGGTGLGLAISNEIVSAHGGFIKVTSAPEKGTTVTVYLPEVITIKNG